MVLELLLSIEDRKVAVCFLISLQLSVLHRRLLYTIVVCFLLTPGISYSCLIIMLGLTTLSLFLVIFYLSSSACSAIIDQKANAPVLFFLFIENGDRFYNSEVWARYFRKDEAEGATHHHILIYASDQTQYEYPTDLRMVVVKSRSSVKDKESDSYSACGNKAKSEQHVIQQALIHSHSHDDKFILLSSDAVPTKSLDELYLHLFPTARAHNPESMFCLSDSTQWEKHDEFQYRRLVKHSEYVILSKPDARAAVEEYVAHNGRVEDRYSLLHTFHSDQPRCRHHYWLYYAVYGDVDIEKGVAAVRGADENQKKCFLADLVAGPKGESGEYKVSDGFISSISMQHLESLISVKHVYFARSFRSEGEGANSAVTSGALSEAVGAAHSVSLLKALSSLGVLDNFDSDSASTTTSMADAISSTGSSSSNSMGQNIAGQNIAGQWNFSFDPIDRTEQFRKLQGDNTGLRVLVVSIDSRPVRDTLSTADYVSMTAVLRHSYCKQHGYGYLAVHADDALILQGIRERYPEELTSAGALGGAKYGLANFHPGLRQFRASAFAR